MELWTTLSGERPCLVNSVPVHDRGESSLPIQTALWSVILWVLFIVAGIVLLLLLLLPLKIY